MSWDWPDECALCGVTIPECEEGYTNREGRPICQICWQDTYEEEPTDEH